MEELQAAGQVYYQLLEQQQFIEEDLDYTKFDLQKPLLDRLSQVNNCGITVFDLFQKTHIYTSFNFSEIFGYDLNALEVEGNDYFNSRVHPADLLQLTKNGINILKLFYQMEKEERTSYKLITEYRVRGKENEYIRVIEQHQALELDKRGNVWLSLGVIDASPDQSPLDGVKSSFFNYKTGTSIPVFSGEDNSVQLTKREQEVLQLVKDGHPSKEISGRLFISVHTVNTHRQRILEKLSVKNSHEAISFASSLGLIR